VCPKCAAGPSGEAGHSDLRESFRSGIGTGGAPAFIIYLCAACGSMWSMRSGVPEESRWTRKA